MTEKPELGMSGADITAAVVRSFISIVPSVGQALQEIITALIPNQRTERFEKYLELLAEEVAKLAISIDELKKPENVDLIEDGAYLAVRALTDERKLYIAKIVAKGIADQDQSKLREKRVLKILEDLDDQEILILAAYGSDHVQSSLQDIRPQPAAMASPQDVKDRAALFAWAHDRLFRLGLLAKHNVRPGKEGFDGLTSLGRAVLRAADLLPIGGVQDRSDS